MNIRRGMARIARVAAVAYWAIALVIVGINGLQTYRDAPKSNFFDQFADDVPLTEPGEQNWETYTVPVPDGRKVVVRAESRERAVAGAHEWAASNPKPRPIRQAALAVAKGLSIALLVYLLLWAFFRAVRWIALGFMDAPEVSKP